MNKDTIEGNWKQFEGKIKEKWGKLTDDDLTRIKGNAKEAEGILQEKYGRTKDQAKKEWEDFQKSCGCSSSDDKAA